MVAHYHGLKVWFSCVVSVVILNMKDLGDCGIVVGYEVNLPDWIDQSSCSHVTVCLFLLPSSTITLVSLTVSYSTKNKLLDSVFCVPYQ